MIGVIDYGAGNLSSVQRCLRAVGSSAVCITEPEKLEDCRAVLLPGVGAFGAGMRKMRESGMADAVVDFAASGKPLLGVCLGMQFLLSRSFEFGEHEGLGLIPGTVQPIEHEPGWPVPNTGWCNVEFVKDTGATSFFGTMSGMDFYFVHSYHCVPDDVCDILAITQYGDRHLAAAIGRDNVFGCQFHPELSDRAGIEIYREFGQRASSLQARTSA